MTADFIAACIMLILMWIAMTISAFMSGPVGGLIAMILMGLYTALLLWIQWCIRMGGCLVLSWLLVAMYGLFFLLFVIACIATLASKKPSKEDDDRRDRHDRRDRDDRDYRD